MRWLSRIWLFTFLAAAAAPAQSPNQGPPRDFKPEAAAGYVIETVVRTAAGPATVRVEVRNWIIPGHVRVEKLLIPAEGTIVAQLRGGELTTIIGGRREERREGDFFTVPGGAGLGVETEDDSAILQTVWIIPPG